MDQQSDLNHFCNSLCNVAKDRKTLDLLSKGQAKKLMMLYTKLIMNPIIK